MRPGLGRWAHGLGAPWGSSGRSGPPVLSPLSTACPGAVGPGAPALALSTPPLSALRPQLPALPPPPLQGLVDTGTRGCALGSGSYPGTRLGLPVSRSPRLAPQKVGLQPVPVPLTFTELPGTPHLVSASRWAGGRGGASLRASSSESERQRGTLQTVVLAQGGAAAGGGRQHVASGEVQGADQPGRRRRKPLSRMEPAAKARAPHGPVYLQGLKKGGSPPASLLSFFASSLRDVQAGVEVIWGQHPKWSADPPSWLWGDAEEILWHQAGKQTHTETTPRGAHGGTFY